MKKLVLGLTIVASTLSVSAFGANCNQFIQGVASAGESFGMSKVALIQANSKLEIATNLKKTFNENPEVETLLGTNRSEIDKEVATAQYNVDLNKSELTQSIKNLELSKNSAREFCN
ncbi:MAG: hypothetical protein Q7U04_05505 [Bacteriovorax sp.]|nr:hypothetical protein [Bacteriovorax sp.]